MNWAKPKLNRSLWKTCLTGGYWRCKLSVGHCSVVVPALQLLTESWGLWHVFVFFFSSLNGLSAASSRHLCFGWKVPNGYKTDLENSEITIITDSVSSFSVWFLAWSHSSCICGVLLPVTTRDRALFALWNGKLRYSDGITWVTRGLKKKRVCILALTACFLVSLYVYCSPSSCRQ